MTTVQVCHSCVMLMSHTMNGNKLNYNKLKIVINKLSDQCHSEPRGIKLSIRVENYYKLSEEW